MQTKIDWIIWKREWKVPWNFFTWASLAINQGWYKIGKADKIFFRFYRFRCTNYILFLAYFIPDAFSSISTLIANIYHMQVSKPNKSQARRTLEFTNHTTATQTNWHLKRRYIYTGRYTLTTANFCCDYNGGWSWLTVVQIYFIFTFHTKI